MITGFLLLMVGNLLDFVLQILSQDHLPVEFTDALAYFWGVINSFSYVLPVDTLLQAFLLIIAVEAFLLLFHAALWVIKHIPFIGRG